MAEVQGAELQKATYLQQEAGEIKLTLILLLSSRHLTLSGTLSLSSSSTSLNIKKLLDDIFPAVCFHTAHELCQEAHRIKKNYKIKNEGENAFEILLRL